MATRRVSVVELRRDLARVLDDVERGDAVVVTRSGRLVARMLPPAQGDLRSAGVRPARRPGPIRRVKPLATKLRISLTQSVLEERG